MPGKVDVHGDSQGASPGDFEYLLQRAIGGDEDAVTKVVESLRTYLLLIANQEVDRDIQAKFGASDLVQSALIVAHQKFAEFRGKSLEALHGWVRQILRNDLIDARRRFRDSARRSVAAEVSINDSQGPRFSLVDPLETPAALNSRQEQFQTVQDALSELPPNYQKVIELRNWQGKSFSEIGQIVGTGEDAARKLWSRALIKLKEVLQAKSPEFGSIAWRELE